VALTIDQRLSGDVVVLRAQGRITLGEETNSLREAIRGLIETGHRKILLNLQGVRYIDSAGLGTLVSAYWAVRSRCQPNRRWTSSCPSRCV
jgi:anti-sigma B factor antagonist